LFKAKELEDGKIDSGVESDTSLVWSEGGIKLTLEFLKLTADVLELDSRG
jgi:hypothetical protein